MQIAYHVAPRNHKGSLVSLFRQHGDAAYDMFCERWPEGAELAFDHVHYVHFFDSLEDALEHKRDFCKGGKIYSVDLDRLKEDYFRVETDNLEFSHPVVRDDIAEEYLTVVPGRSKQHQISAGFSM